MLFIIGILLIVGVVTARSINSHRQELLKIIKDKDEQLDAATRKLVTLEGTVENIVARAQDTDQELTTTKQHLLDQIAKNSEILSSKKSSEVRLGNISENVLPFLKELPYDGTNLRHLGQPIDFVYFDYDPTPTITFVEVKSGAAKESKRQKLIKEAIRMNQIHYDLVQITDKGIKVTRKT